MPDGCSAAKNAKRLSLDGRTALVTVGNLAAYASTKGAIKHFAFVLGGRGIRVNPVAPGVVATDVELRQDGCGPRHSPRQAALNRIAGPGDIGGAVAFVASDEARWIDGDTLRVDGGSKLGSVTSTEEEQAQH